MATYNGWTNYQTWAVKLWIDNEEGPQGYWTDRAERIGKDGAYQLSKEIQEQHEESSPAVSGVFADLLNSALGSVNWYEIAESLLEDLLEEETEEEEAEIESSPAVK